MIVRRIRRETGRIRLTISGSGLLVVAEEASIRGGRAKRYRHHPMVDQLQRPADKPADKESRRTLQVAVANALVRRAAAQVVGPQRRQHLTDAELWVDPEVWADVVRTVHAASERLHEAARPARTPGTVRTSATIALFEMDAHAR